MKAIDILIQSFQKKQNEAYFLQSNFPTQKKKQAVSKRSSFFSLQQTFYHTNQAYDKKTNKVFLRECKTGLEVSVKVRPLKETSANMLFGRKIAKQFLRTTLVLSEQRKI